MKLRDIYAQPGVQLSIEFFPPKTDDGVRKLFEELEVLRELRPSFCSVTFGAAGSTRDRTVEMVERIHRETGLEVMCHLSVVGQSKDEVRGVLAELRRKEIDNLIALRGDPPRGVAEWTPHPDGFLYSVDLVKEARALDWFSIAVAGFPETHPQAESPESDLQYLKEKVDAGADVVITQLFYDNDDFYHFVERARAIGITVPIVPGVFPVISAEQTRRFTSFCGSRIPPRLGALLDQVAGDDDAAIRMGIDYATEQCAGLLEFGIPGIHFYSMNRSRSAAAIVDNLSLRDRREPAST
ncbi:MAG: methylenetetrahydrofolate reductase [NAD(P)H] [Actinomycetota bacterium]